MSELSPERIKSILEAAILAADGPLDRDTMLTLFDEQDCPSKADLSRLLESLSEDYAERGIELKEVATGFRFQVRTELGPWVSRLWQEKPPRYSRAVLETLALMAYRQPITRGEIEEIRGVSVSSHIIKSLMERGWVRVVGHRDVPGRPAMFATTRQFLDYFDLKSLDELPPLAEIRDLDKLNEELALSDAPSENESVSEGEDGDGAEPDNANVLALNMHDEPEIDESTLMSMEKVDSVIANFEAEFRRRPDSGASEEEGASPDEQDPEPPEQEAADMTADEERSPNE
ncbi:SMC-Scp complex subunit ScpB [Alloalcanivorax xenomutans]|uniref:SMC-Scp complex subunit ScpB n=1 Tax=Alloalcanivorax xenomutans TaxID=1094342 RepID=UPI0004B05ABB|nr:SMC-Scp complex subunit ScpB [Alloalcanivorax xenomutans]KYZ87939.1 SMC-Scp complex subunit ScpB [Alcanivorax sp. KX64203]